MPVRSKNTGTLKAKMDINTELTCFYLDDFDSDFGQTNNDDQILNLGRLTTIPRKPIFLPKELIYSTKEICLFKKKWRRRFYRQLGRQ